MSSHSISSTGSSSELDPMTPPHPARHLLRAKDLVDARYREPLDVAQLARAARLSQAHFSREFRRAFGETPHQYLLTRRLERAAALLRNTDRSVADICFTVGLQQRRVVHDELRPGVRALPDGVPGDLSAGSHPCLDSDLRAARVGAAAVQQFSRRQPRAAWLA